MQDEPETKSTPPGRRASASDTIAAIFLAVLIAAWLAAYVAFAVRAWLL